ncbi:hypothetical protein [Ovoidimarina sediminis]|uniref:hypothetical protein n=1 Tax=Ovoidimarina sediminis TaxID=3079856 RepID=UPI00292F3C67|nr:hypothetical protein [Rhodophyticola sp. MJ-SS7]
MNKHIPPGATLSPAEVALEDVLRRMAREIEQLADDSDALQKVIGTLVGEDGVRLDATTLRDIQSADRISQILRRLADLATFLVGRLPDGIRVDPSELRDAVVLDSLSERLLHDGSGLARAGCATLEGEPAAFQRLDS